MNIVEKTPPQINRMLLLFCLVVAMFIGNFAMATNYYVATTGNNSNSGTSTSEAWKTINYAAGIAAAGDTVFIAPGTYNETVTVSNSGTPGKPIVFQGNAENRPIVDGTGFSTGYGTSEGLIRAVKKSNLVFENIEINNAPNAGIAINGPNVSNITIRNLKTWQTIGSGIWCNGLAGNAYNGIVNLLIEDCEIIKTHYQKGKGYQESLSVSGGCSNIIIRRNHVHDSGPGVTRGGPLGIDVKDGIRNAEIYNNRVHDITYASGIYTDGWDSTNDSIKIYNNVVYNCLDAGISIGAELNGYCKNVSVFNNVVYSCSGAGVAISGYGHDANHISGIKVFNNTIYKNGKDVFGGISISDQTADVIIKNNIISDNFHYQIWADYINPEIKVSHNIFNGTGSNADYGNYFLQTNPIFVDAPANNFKLKANSPAINRGTTELQATNDFNGLARPVGDLPDLGAYEFPDVLPANPWPDGSEKMVDSDPSNIVINESYPINPNQNLIKWGDFEGPSAFTGAWAGWGGNSISTEESFSPNHSLKISPKSGGGGAAYTIEGIQEGIEYEFKFKAKMKDPAPIDPHSGYYKESVSILFKSKGGKRLTIPKVDINSTSWKSYTLKTTAPKYAYRMESNVWSSGTTAPTFFDDWELYAVGGVNTVTALKTIDSAKNMSAKVFPNPVRGNILNISTPMEGEKWLHITDVTGQVILKENIGKVQSYTLDISDLHLRGMYIVKVVSDFKSSSQKILIL